MTRGLRIFFDRLQRDRSGLALLEFAFALPIFMTLSLAGAELTNYITTRMRVSQLALQLADDAARMGNGSLLSAKTIKESDINDLFTGAQLQSGELNLGTNARIILTDLEPIANPNPTGKFKIRWQRCYGSQAHVSKYGKAGDTNLSGIGDAGRQVTAQLDNATMFVELYYVYKPLIGLGRFAPSANFSETASMAVRDRRDLSDDTINPDGTTNPNPQHPNGIYKVAGVTPATC